MVGTVIIAVVGYGVSVILAAQTAMDLYRSAIATRKGERDELGERSLNALCCAIAAIIFAATTRSFTGGQF